MFAVFASPAQQAGAHDPASRSAYAEDKSQQG
jgi:hypothetical protein